jgi:hypothetical protein
MKRLALFLVFVWAFWGISLSASSVMADDRRSNNVAVSFGLWDPNNPNLMGAPLDRLIADPPMGGGVNDILVPDKVSIKEGDAVNFIIGGGHVLAIYDDGTKPKDINPDAIEPGSSCPTTAGGVLSDPINRIYRGPCFSTNFGTNPSTTIVRRDGVEVVQFTKPGTYLVICARKNHFIDSETGEFKMFGFVKVEKEHRRY